MKKIVIRTGFHPEVKREYNGEHIYKIIGKREKASGRDFQSGVVMNGNDCWQLENMVWVTERGPEKYVTNWTGEERWGRVYEVEYDDAGNEVSSEELGFMILQVDRAKGLL